MAVNRKTIVFNDLDEIYIPIKEPESPKNFRASASVYKKEIVLYIDDMVVDLSHMLSDETKFIDAIETGNPIVSWKIRADMLRVAKDYMKKNYPNFPYQKMYA